jgi:glycosyltransferase involved in cell wall biosynthesis
MACGDHHPLHRLRFDHRAPEGLGLGRGADHDIGEHERRRHIGTMPGKLDLALHAQGLRLVEPEAFGRAVIEAQAMERVVIAAGHGGAAETVQHGETGLLVKPGDAGALAKAIALVLAWPEAERRAMGTRARTSVLKRYTVSAMQQATLAVYEEVLAWSGESRRP